MTMQIAGVNGIEIAYQVVGSGPPLVLIMGYRLSSAAWPVTFVETLARHFTVITLDNRGTGRSAKPVHGYALANMARDIHALLDQLGLENVHLLGYSMGGAIAQEFVRQFPERVTSLILCATMCGGARATYANASAIRVMRDLDGLSPEQAAKQIWQVTYAPVYLAHNRQAVEAQMQREIVLPTPLHAADLQFQAFAEFDGSSALSDICCPTLVLTGDVDALIPPQNSAMMAARIPGAKLVVLPGGGHRVLWESTQRCLDQITAFLSSLDHDGATATPRDGQPGALQAASNAFASTIELFLTWPLLLTSVFDESVSTVLQSIMTRSASRFGDGKPVILVTLRLGSELTLVPLSAWLGAIGYRPVTAGFVASLDHTAREQALSKLIRDTAQRLGRKVVLVAHSIDMAQALRIAETHDEWISDVVVLDAARRPDSTTPRRHFIAPGVLLLQGILELPRVLRGIGIELIGKSEARQARGDNRLMVEGRLP